MAVPSSRPPAQQQQQQAQPDLSWFCCVCCARRPIPQASFSMLLTTCSHIVCSSCWSTRARSPGECPRCGVKANTLNLTTTRPLPKQLEPYFKNPVDILNGMLTACRFQEHQKRLSLPKRKKAWVLINHRRAKEDYEREYRECKEIQSRLSQQRRSLKQVVDGLTSMGLDPMQCLQRHFSEDVIKTVLGPVLGSRSGVPPTPFVGTPGAGRPLSTSTPALSGTTPALGGRGAGGGGGGGVEFAEPKKLPHTMRGSVTSLTVRRSPSNPPTPMSQLVRQTSTPGFMATGPQQSINPQAMDTGTYQGQPPILTANSIHQHSSNPSERMCTPVGSGSLVRPPMIQAGRPNFQTGRPFQQHAQPQCTQSKSISQQPVLQYVRPSPRHATQPVLQSAQRIPQSGQHSSHHIQHPGQTVLQSGRPTQQSGQQTFQTVQPTPQYGLPAKQLGQPAFQSGRPTPNSGRPIVQHTPNSVQPARMQGIHRTNQHPPTGHTTSHQQIPPHHQPGSVRIRAVPPSSSSSVSTPQNRIFPSPSPSFKSQSSRTSSHHPPPPPPPPSSSHLSLANTATTNRITIHPPPSIKPLSQAMSNFHSTTQPRSSPVSSRARTPTNPSPLLTSYSTPCSSPPCTTGAYQSQRSQGLPWKHGHAPPPGARLCRSFSGPRLTPMKT